VRIIWPSSIEVSYKCRELLRYLTNGFERIHDNHSGSATKPLIIHLPSQSIGHSPRDVPIPGALLASTVIQIYPRWSPNHLFPNPIHDILHAYNWILENILQQKPHGLHRSIAIYGEGLGGTLATSLALTESRPSQTRPTISVLAVKDAIFNWSRIASTPPPPNTPAPQESHVLTQDADPLSHGADLARLYALRSQLFRDPASTFDAFASPLLFFRTAGLAIPASFPEAASSSQAEEAQEDASNFVSRKSHLRFPPKRSGLRIPVTRIGVSGGGAGGGEVKGKGRGKGKARLEDRGLLWEQAEEMVKLMRRSVVLHEGKERRDVDFDSLAEAERRVTLVELDGLNGKVGDGAWAAEFFAEVLSKE